MSFSNITSKFTLNEDHISSIIDIPPQDLENDPGIKGIIDNAKKKGKYFDATNSYGPKSLVILSNDSIYAFSLRRDSLLDAIAKNKVKPGKSAVRQKPAR